ncbi:MAG TPA: VanZ family protein [Saprospiraceae bacterium]|nr:VanZ family protein [Saprospiraceae bacterium]HMQ84654.1 VanZ family protein [Saprospiraceae bacterium]
MILVLSLGRGIQLPPLNNNWVGPDKLAHAGAYFVLSALFIYGFFVLKKLSWKISILVVIGGALYGFLLEMAQFAFFPHRFFEFFDIIANIIGSIGSLALSQYLLSKLKI